MLTRFWEIHQENCKDLNEKLSAVAMMASPDKLQKVVL